MGWGWGRVEIRDTQPSGIRPRPLAEDSVNICSGALEKKLIATVNVRRGSEHVSEGLINRQALFLIAPAPAYRCPRSHAQRQPAVLRCEAS